MARRIIFRRARWRGQVLIALLVLIGLGMIGVLYSFLPSSNLTILTNKATNAALAEARGALIGRAASDADRPGSLPCPDTDNDGLEDWSGANCTAYIGRLPWQTLGLPDLRDGSGERLWYALSSNFRDNAVVQPLNSDSVGQLMITGVSPANNVVAIIFASGPAIGVQVRDSANANNVANYLEGENSNGDTIYTTAVASDTFNDQLLAVTSDALFSVVAVRVTKEAQAALEAYRAANGYYPYASSYSAGAPYYCQEGLYDGRIPMTIQGSIGPPVVGCNSQAEWSGQLPAWFGANNWNLVTHYGVGSLCTVDGASEKTFCDNYGGDPTGSTFPGYPPLTVTGVTTTARTVVIVTGGVLGSQTRPCPNASNCLEDADNYNGNSVYVKPSRFPASNDHMAVMCGTSAPCAAVP